MADTFNEWNDVKYRSRTYPGQVYFDREEIYPLNFDIRRKSPSSTTATTIWAPSERMEWGPSSIDASKDDDTYEKDLPEYAVSPSIDYQQPQPSSDTCSACTIPGGSVTSTTTATSLSLPRSIQSSVKRYFPPVTSANFVEPLPKRIKGSGEAAEAADPVKGTTIFSAS